MIENMSRVMQAVVFAEECHRGQKRKCRDVPYIAHPVMVAMLVQSVGGSDDEVIAALLHDVVEDCGVTFPVLQEKFGPLVMAIVRDLTEPDKTLPWEVRKEQAIAHVSTMRFESVLVKTADVLHNVQDTLDAFAEKGYEAFAYFKAPKEAVVDRYRRVMQALRNQWPHNPLIDPLLKAVADLRQVVGS